MSGGHDFLGVREDGLNGDNPIGDVAGVPMVEHALKVVGELEPRELVA